LRERLCAKKFRTNVKDEPVGLRLKEFELLATLAARKG
jgi:DNA-binding response OmpR family regulator